MPDFKQNKKKSKKVQNTSHQAQVNSSVESYYAQRRRILEESRNSSTYKETLLTKKKFDPRKELFQAWEIVQSISSKNIPNNIISDRRIHIIAESLHRIKDQDYFDFIAHFWDNSDLLENPYYIENVRAFERMFINNDKWVKDYQSWKKLSHNAYKQFSSLLRHLFAKYKMPAFMDKAFTSSVCEERFIQWYIWMGQGNNIRKAKDLPCPITKMVAHYFLQAPDSCEILEAFRYAKVINEGGSDHIAKAILKTQIGKNFGFSRNLEERLKEEEFWMSVIRFFIQNPMLDPVQYGPLIDYIYAQKYQMALQADGQMRPAQPHFSMHHRDATALMNAMERWHRDLNKVKVHAIQVKTWPARTNIQPYFLNRKDSSWTITEITSRQELMNEGRIMRHCIASYAESCIRGNTSIWSLQFENEKFSKKKLVTIKVDNLNKSIPEARGFCNRLPTSEEKNIISRWAGANNIRY